MPLTAQEQRCVDLVLPVLSHMYGGSWRFDHSLDDLHNSEASPECVVTNGTFDAAIEVKRLTGDSIIGAYREAIQSLKRALAPSCGGYYWLSPAVDFRLPIDGRTRRLLKSEIERVAPTLDPGEKGFIRVPRSAHVALGRPNGPGFVYCCHDGSGHLVRAVSQRVTGSFVLVDQGMLEHNFVTAEGLEQFQTAVADACRRRTITGDGHFEWYEEWELTRSRDLEDEDPRDKDGVWIICVTGARDVSASVAEAVELMLWKALKKFEARQWASKHVIVFERSDALSSAERVREALSWMNDEELTRVDLILHVDDDDVSLAWQAQSHPNRNWLG